MKRLFLFSLLIILETSAVSQARWHVNINNVIPGLGTAWSTTGNNLQLIINGANAGNSMDNCYHVVIISNILYSTTTLDGFIIPGGNANGIRNIVVNTQKRYRNYDGRRYNAVSFSPEIRNSIIWGNTHTNRTMNNVQVNSPAINIGNNIYFNSVQIPNLSHITTDLGGTQRIYNGTVDLGTYEYQNWAITPDSNGIVYVNKHVVAGGDSTGRNWANAAVELADALYAAKLYNAIKPDSIKQIWVAEATYFPMYKAADTTSAGIATTDRDKAFVLVKDVQIYGGFPTNADDNLNAPNVNLSIEQARNTRNYSIHKTILSGNIGDLTDSTDNCYHVIVSASDVGIARLDGFIVTAGYANGSGQLNVNTRPISRGHGGGFYCRVSHPQFTNLIVEDNFTTGNGGGLYNSYASPILTNIVVFNNIANGSGGGIYNTASSTNPILTNVTITNNKANTGSSICNTSTASLQIRNTIIWGNINRISGTFEDTIISGNPTYLNCLIGGTVLGNGIIFNTDPLFADAANGNYRLSRYSPCINAGDNSIYNQGSTPDILHITNDLAGNLRILGNTIDLGAYESLPIASDNSGIVYVNKYVGAGGDSTGRNWANAAIEVADALFAAKTNKNIKQIWVAEATYYPLYHAADDSTSDGDRNNAFVLVKDVQVYGGFPTNADDNLNAPNATLSMEQARNTRNWAIHETTLSGNIGIPDSTDNCYHVVVSSGNVGKACLDGFIITEGNADGGSSTDLVINGNIIQRDFGGGIMSFSSSPVLTHLKIHGNYADNGGGISNTYSSPIITNILIYNNNANYGGGIDNNASSPILTNITIVNNTANRGGGIYNSNTSSSQMRNSIIWKNNVEKTGAGDTIYYSHTLLENANIGNGIILNGDPLFVDAFNHDYHLRPNSPAINKGENAFYNSGNLPDLSYIAVDLDKNTRILNGVIDLGTYEISAIIIPDINGIVYVNKQLTTGDGSGKNWANAAKEVGDALHTAKLSNAIKSDSIKEVWVAAETYYPLYKVADTTTLGAATTNRDKSFLLAKDVQLYGGFPINANDVLNAPHATLTKNAACNTRNWTIHETILSGDIGNLNDSLDNCYHVVVSVGDVGTASLDGFIVIKGNANNTDSITVNSRSISRDNSGGIYINFSSPVRLTNVIISNNTAINSGGGMLIGNSSSPVLTNVIINNNTANEGGGIFISHYSSPVLTNVTISNNIATNGGGIYYYYNDSSPKIHNSIIWGNTLPNGTIDNVNNFKSNPLYQNSLVGGVSIGNGIILNSDPLFVDVANDNYRLTCCSPALNAGNNAYFSSDSTPDISHIQTDLDGNPRFYNSGIVDLGAYELQQSCITPSIVLLTGDTSICKESSFDIKFSFTGTLPLELIYTKDNGITYDTLRSNTYSYTWNVNIQDTTIYKFVGIRDINCNVALNDSIVINIIPIPTITNIFTNDTLCSGDTTTGIYFTGIADFFNVSVSYYNQWIPNESSSNQNYFPSWSLTNPTTMPATDTITVTPQFYQLGSHLCLGQSKSFTITVLPNSSINIPNNDTLCHGDTTTPVTFTGNAQWQISVSGDRITGLPSGIQTGNMGRYVLENTSNAPQTSIIEISSISNIGTKTCQGKDTNFSITILPEPKIMNIPADYSLCSGDKTTSVSFIGTFTDYQWEVTGNVMDSLPLGIRTGNFGEYPLYNKTNNFLTATISFEPYYLLGNKKCTGNHNSFSITVAPNPVIDNIPANAVLCSGEKTTPVTFNGVYSFYRWEAFPTLDSIPSGSHNSDFEEYTIVNKTSSPLSTSVKIIPYFVSGPLTCQGKDTSFSITVNPEPTLINILSNQTLCDGNNTTSVLFSGTATQFDWTASGSISGMPSGTQTGDFGIYHLTNKTTYPLTSGILVTPKYSNEGRICSGQSQSFTVTVNPATSIESITPNAYILCENEELTITVNGSGGSAYSWYHNGNLLRGDTSNQYTVSKTQATHTGFYYVESKNNCGKSKSSSIYISIRSDSMLVEKWNDVILVDNSHYDFYGYQWYRNDILLPGAINQFYQELGGLKGCYRVELTLKDGSKLFSCERCVDKVPKSSFIAYPNPVKQNKAIKVLIYEENEIYNKPMHITFYTSEGKLLESRQTSYGDFQIETSSLSAGIYILKVTTNDGQTYNEKIIIY